MTPDRFRRCELALPGAVEGAHGGHPDFRVGGKVFASLGAPDASFGMVKLTPDQQAMQIELAPDVFQPVRGAWGEKGYTNVRLAAADAATLKHVLALAHRNCSPQKPKAGQNPAFNRKTSRTELLAAITRRDTEAIVRHGTGSSPCPHPFDTSRA